jgi:competence protein ComEA
MPRPILLAIGLLGAAGLVLAVLGRVASPPAAAIEIAPPSEASASPTPALVVVDLGGAVARPGVLRLPAGSRVVDALAAAGGPHPDADLAALNRAAVLRDGERIYVPRLGEVPPLRAGGGDPRVDLNRASPAELEALPGIGPGIAARIVRTREQRAFTRVEELQTRGLVSARVFAELRDLVVVR